MVGLASEFANRQVSLPCLLVLASFALLDHMTSALSFPPSPSRCNGHELFVSNTGWDVLLKRDRDQSLIDASRSN